MSGPGPAERLIALFQRNDRDGSGMIDREKLIRVMGDIGRGLLPPITEEQFRDTLDRKWQVEESINYVEFIQWLRGIAEAAQARPHLVIHLDVNKTIIMSDHSNGKTEEAVVNEVLANTCWGIEVDGAWKLMGEIPSIFRPDQIKDGQQQTSYAEWLEKSMPGREHRKKRTKCMTIFTDEGEPGAAFASHKNSMLEALRKPDGAYSLLIPSFFEMLASLKRNRRSFSLCFRTFGEDLPQVSIELNQFCEGKHPLFPGVYMDGSDGEADYRWNAADPDTSGTFHRHADQDSIVLGTYEQPGEGKHRDATDMSINFFRTIPGVSRVISGREAVQEFLWNMLGKPGTYGFRDFFPYWKHMHNTSAGGKLFFFTPSQSTNRHEIFFDDNIRYNDAHIVQPINVLQPERKLWATALLGRHLCRVDPLQAIYDQQYFVKEVAKLEDGYARHFVLRKKLISKIKMHVLLTKTLLRTSAESRMSRSKSKDKMYDPWTRQRHEDDEISTAQTDYEDRD